MANTINKKDPKGIEWWLRRRNDEVSQVGDGNVLGMKDSIENNQDDTNDDESTVNDSTGMSEHEAVERYDTVSNASDTSLMMKKTSKFAPLLHCGRRSMIQSGYADVTEKSTPADASTSTPSGTNSKNALTRSKESQGAVSSIGTNSNDNNGPVNKPIESNRYSYGKKIESGRRSGSSNKPLTKGTNYTKYVMKTVGSSEQPISLIDVEPEDSLILIDDDEQLITIDLEQTSSSSFLPINNMTPPQPAPNAGGGGRKSIASKINNFNSVGDDGILRSPQKNTRSTSSRNSNNSAGSFFMSFRPSMIQGTSVRDTSTNNNNTNNNDGEEKHINLYDTEAILMQEKKKESAFQRAISAFRGMFFSGTKSYSPDSSLSGTNEERYLFATPERITNKQELDVQKKKRRILIGMLAFTALGLIGAIIAVSVMLVNTSKNKKNFNAPAYDENLNEQQLLISSIISKHAVVDINTQYEPSTPQYKARKWILFTDTLYSNASPDDADLREQIIQRFILAVFHFSTSNEQYRWDKSTKSWLHGYECDKKKPWTGVVCNENRQVQAITLEKVGLIGTIPLEIGHLSHLEHLVLKDNEGLVGTIPVTLGKLKSMKQLGLYSNNLTGTIPKGLFTASKLQYLNLQNNWFKGKLPTEEIENLTELEVLILSHNELTGTIPVRSMLKLTKLEYMGLNSNKFSGQLDSAIGQFRSLKYLYLNGNDLKGTLPAELGNVETLLSINMDDAKIFGKIPTTFGLLSNLEHLSLQSNFLTGTLPSQLSKMVALQTININSNRFGGTLPAMSSMKGLRSALMVGNQFKGGVTKTFEGVTGLELLFLSDNQFTGSIPSFLNSSQSLRGLYLSENRFSGTIKDSLCNKVNLEALFLDSNELSGSIPDCISNLNNLKQLYLFKNELTGNLPVEISQLRQLSGLGIENNNFSGDVPEVVCGNLTSVNKNNEAFQFWSDCGGENPVVTCECCTTCCPNEDQCREVN